ncbi:sigma-70 family RNA polymerase sigma factor [Tautonia marina]|uniref:sigma-70 family RNA polymerase sigma factor n=1 Tax=Tautonia marina TaxID=2653855 RepID=UPI001260D683|nr:sigma-70 family RNA polymerase sigma factor [Tautonia marina]
MPARGSEDGSRIARDLEACRSYLLQVAERHLPGAIRSKVGASDLVQESLLDAHQRRQDFAGTSLDELRAWLYRLLMFNLAEKRRAFLGTARADVRRELPDGGIPCKTLTADDPTPGTTAIGREQAERLAGAMARLRERDRLVLLWRHHEGLGFAAIGQRLGDRTEAAARQAYQRACERLAEQLGGADSS